MSKVCSNCADGRPSSVTAVHLSGHVTGVLLPLQTVCDTQRMYVEETGGEILTGKSLARL